MPHSHAAAIIRCHYALRHPPTPAEVTAEIANLRRKISEGLADDLALSLAARLGVS